MPMQVKIEAVVPPPNGRQNVASFPHGWPSAYCRVWMPDKRIEGSFSSTMRSPTPPYTRRPRRLPRAASSRRGSLHASLHAGICRGVCHNRACIHSESTRCRPISGVEPAETSVQVRSDDLRRCDHLPDKLFSLYASLYWLYLDVLLNVELPYPLETAMKCLELRLNRP